MGPCSEKGNLAFEYDYIKISDWTDSRVVKVTMINRITGSIPAYINCVIPTNACSKIGVVLHVICMFSKPPVTQGLNAVQR